MKIIWTALLVFTLGVSYGQNARFQSLLDSAKTLFKSQNGLSQQEFDQFDYGVVVRLLNDAIKIDDNNAEAHYFLGYAYSRMNSRDGRSMIRMDIDLVLKASEQFERVNKLSPRYDGEIVLLDPYSKISSEWGSMAMSYWHNGKKDSAIWAFKEGKKRGGFSEFNLRLCRKMLDACSQQSMLITYGDNFTIPLWYLQIAESYRRDISVIDLNLLNTVWYPSYLSQNHMASFDLPEQALNSIEYCSWTATPVKIGDFMWTVRPTYANQYLLRGDRVFLSLLKKNAFKKPVFFSIGVYDYLRLSIPDSAVTNTAFVNEMTTAPERRLSFETYKKNALEGLALVAFMDRNSKEELTSYNILVYNLLNEVNRYIDRKEDQQARNLLNVITSYEGLPEKSNRKYIDYLQDLLQ